jgi:class I fructose-bisphosphate aldolase
MSEGKRYRLGRIFGRDGRALILPVDHGIALGRIEGLEDPVSRIGGLLALDCDGFLMSPGVVRHTVSLFAHRQAPARLLTLDTFWREEGESASAAGLVSWVRTAARLGVDCVKLLMVSNVSSREWQATLTRIGEVIRAAEEFDMPVMVEPLVWGGERTDETVAREGSAARIAMELGADIIKIAYPGPELMARWAEELRVPLVILGGPRSKEPDAVVELAGDAMAAGARGIIIGRNVWQREPEVTQELVLSLREIVHPIRAATTA